MKLDVNFVGENYETTTFVGSMFALQLDVTSPPYFDKEIEWAYIVVAPPEVEITKDISPPLTPIIDRQSSVGEDYRRQIFLFSFFCVFRR